MIELLNKLIKEHEEELIIIEKSYDKNMKAGMNDLAYKRDTQAILVRRFIKDLKKFFEQ